MTSYYSKPLCLHRLVHVLSAIHQSDACLMGATASRGYLQYRSYSRDVPLRRWDRWWPCWILSGTPWYTLGCLQYCLPGTPCTASLVHPVLPPWYTLYCISGTPCTTSLIHPATPCTVTLVPCTLTLVHPGTPCTATMVHPVLLPWYASIYLSLIHIWRCRRRG